MENKFCMSCGVFVWRREAILSGNWAKHFFGMSWDYFWNFQWERMKKERVWCFFSLMGASKIGVTVKALLNSKEVDLSDTVVNRGNAKVSLVTKYQSNSLPSNTFYRKHVSIYSHAIKRSHKNFMTWKEFHEIIETRRYSWSQMHSLSFQSCTISVCLLMSLI